MSVVAVKKEGGKITIGADSIRIAGWFGTQEKDKLAKLFRISEELVIGAVGNCATAALFRDFTENHLPRTNDEYGWTRLAQEFAGYLNELKNAPKFDEASFIAAYRHRAFYLGGYFVREISDYYAIGAGADYALAALYLGADVRKAIEAACHLSIFCEKPVNLVELKK